MIPHVCPDASQTRSDALRRSASAHGCNCVPTAQTCLYGPHSALHGLLGAIPHKCPSKVAQARTGRSRASHRGLTAFLAQSLSRKQKAPPAPVLARMGKKFSTCAHEAHPFYGGKISAPAVREAHPIARGKKSGHGSCEAHTLMSVQMGDACKSLHTRGLPHAGSDFRATCTGEAHPNPNKKDRICGL